MATDLTAQVLDALSHSNGPILSAEAFPSVPSTTVKSALDRLGSRNMVTYKTIDREEAILTPEAEGIAADGSHEAKVFEAVRQAVEGLRIADLPVRWLNRMPAQENVAISFWGTNKNDRPLWAWRAQRSGRVKLSKQAGSRRTGIPSRPTCVSLP